MKCPSRRKERLSSLIRDLKKLYIHFIDLTHFEQKGEFLEGKGSCVFDTRNQKIYCNISDRTHLSVAKFLILSLNKISNEPWKLVSFHAVDINNKSIYHTDCMLTVFNKHIAICLEAIKNNEEKLKVIKEITDDELNPRGKYELLNLSSSEIEHMCANCFMLRKENEELAIFMSKRAYIGYSNEHMEILKDNYGIVVSVVDTLEDVGGGSCRCLLAELF